MNAFWPRQLQAALESQSCVVVTVVTVRGSAPRSCGSRMLITASGQYGSIGGGNLEHMASIAAREMLAKQEGQPPKLISFGLGPALNQCCGGAVELLFECHQPGQHEWLDRLESLDRTSHPAVLVTAIDGEQPRNWLSEAGKDLPPDLPGQVTESVVDMAEPFKLVEAGEDRFLVETIEARFIPLYLFGAGHVASALVKVLQDQPFQIIWCDERDEQFPLVVAENVQKTQSDNPIEVARTAKAGSAFLVMTHSHERDEDLCHVILERGDAAWLGLIGSRTKRRRFEHRLAKRGIKPARLELLTCPVGEAGITGKRPATIAISIAAQLLMELVPDNWR